MPFFNDPNIGAAFGSLAQAFAPPSAQDLAALGNAQFAGARTRAQNQEAQMRAALFAEAGNPNLDQAQFDRRNIAAGNYAPVSSYYSVDQGNATKVATNAATNRQSGLNNAATNAQSGRNNFLDNQGALARAFMSPLPRGATAAGLPPELARILGVPELGGQSRVGAPVPDTRSQVEGRILAGMAPEKQQELVRGGADGEATKKIARIAGLLERQGRATGQAAVDAATQIVDLVILRENFDGTYDLIDKSTGLPWAGLGASGAPGAGGSDGPPPSAPPSDEVGGMFNPADGDVGSAYGFTGAASRVYNFVTGSLGGQGEPNIARLQADGDVLREAITNAFVIGYKRQPTAGLLQEIRDLVPEPGSIWNMSTAEQAQQKFESLARQFNTDLATIQAQLQLRLPERQRSELEQRQQALLTGKGQLDNVLRAFKRGVQDAQQGGPPQGVSQPSEPDKDGWVTYPNGVRALRE